MKKFETDNRNEVSEKDNNSETSEKINDTEKKDDNIDNKDRKRKESKNKKEETSKEKLDGEYKNIIDDINKKMESLNKDLTDTKSTLQTLQKDLFSFRTNTLGQNKENIEKKIPQMIDEAFNNKISPVQRNLTFELNQIKYNVTGLEKNRKNMIETNKKKTKSVFIYFTSFKPEEMEYLWRGEFDEDNKKTGKGKEYDLMIISFLKENIQMIQE